MVKTEATQATSSTAAQGADGPNAPPSPVEQKVFKTLRGRVVHETPIRKRRYRKAPQQQQELPQPKSEFSPKPTTSKRLPTPKSESPKPQSASNGYASSSGSDCVIVKDSKEATEFIDLTGDSD